MISLRATLAALICAVVLAPGFMPALAQDKPKAKPKAIKIKQAELDDAAKALAGLDGEQFMLLNGLRYLMRPAYQLEVMAGRRFEPCPLPPYEFERKKPMSLMECLRFWAILASGMKADDVMKRELARFLTTDHKRYGDTLAAYAVPMAICVAATRRPELAHADELKEAAKTIMDKAMRVRSLTAEESPLIKGMTIEPGWYANHMWRALMCRCALELKVKFNENVWEAELKNLSHSAQDELGWIGTRGKGRNPDNDLNCNLLALAAISLALSSPKGAISNAVINSLEKRLKYLGEILTRLHDEYPDELILGARLCMLRSFLPEYAPTDKDPVEWRLEIRTKAVSEVLACGAVRTTHRLATALGLAGTMNAQRAQAPIETALCCLSVCGGLFRQVEPPLKDIPTADLDRAMNALTLLDASVTPEGGGSGDLAARVEIAIKRGADFLAQSLEIAKGEKGRQGAAYLAAALHAMMHGGYAHDCKQVEEGVQWLVGNVDSADPITLCAYTAGIMLMMFGRYYEWLMEEKLVFDSENQNQARMARANVWKVIKPAHRDLIQSLVDYLDKCYAGAGRGGWGYSPKIGTTPGHSDNSVSQFAGCGYKCASMLGATVDTKIFEIEARTLIDQYIPDTTLKKVEFKYYGPEPADDKEGDEKKGDRYAKGGNYEPKQWQGTIQPGGWTYIHAKIDVKKSHGGYMGPQYVGAGMALLASSRDELWAHGALPNELHKQIDMHIFGAQAWLAAQDFWEEFEDQQAEADDEDAEADAEKPCGQNKPGPGWGGIYNLYAIERGCVLGGYDLLNGEVDWYVHGATWLCDSQMENGSWGGFIETAWAVLILRKAAPPTVTRPRKPEEINPTPEPPKPPAKSPVTPGPVKPEPKPPKPVGPVTPGK